MTASPEVEALLETVDAIAESDMRNRSRSRATTISVAISTLDEAALRGVSWLSNNGEASRVDRVYAERRRLRSGPAPL